MTNNVKISLDDIKELVTNIFVKQGCNQENANALANTITKAEEDGSSSHGLFRLPGYVASLKSGKVNGHASPKVVNKTAVILKCDGISNPKATITWYKNSELIDYEKQKNIQLNDSNTKLIIKSLL